MSSQGRLLLRSEAKKDELHWSTLLVDRFIIFLIRPIPLFFWTKIQVDFQLSVELAAPYPHSEVCHFSRLSIISQGCHGNPTVSFINIHFCPSLAGLGESPHIFELGKKKNMWKDVINICRSFMEFLNNFFKDSFIWRQILQRAPTARAKPTWRREPGTSSQSLTNIEVSKDLGHPLLLKSKVKQWGHESVPTWDTDQH